MTFCFKLRCMGEASKGSSAGEAWWRDPKPGKDKRQKMWATGRQQQGSQHSYTPLKSNQSLRVFIHLKSKATSFCPCCFGMAHAQCFPVPFTHLTPQGFCSISLSSLLSTPVSSCCDCIRQPVKVLILEQLWSLSKAEKIMVNGQEVQESRHSI